MIRDLIKKELKYYLKNPIYYLGALLVLVSVYRSVSPYLNIVYFSNESQIQTVSQDKIGDVDIIQGYIPITDEGNYQLAMEQLYDDMVNGMHIGKEKAEAIISHIKEKHMTISEIDDYMDKTLSFKNARYAFIDTKLKKATVEQANNYIKASLERHSYTDYFARKYADYLGVSIIFYSIVIFAFLYMRDMKKDIYELLHTKPIKARQYFFGKITGGMTAILLICFVVTAIFDGIAMFHGIQNGFPVNWLDVWKAVFLYVVPNLFMVICVYTFVSVVFKSPLPAVPALLLYLIYSNMGTVDENGLLAYKIRKLAILVRFPENFFETTVPFQIYINQALLLFIAIVILLISVTIWKRRRIL